MPVVPKENLAESDHRSNEGERVFSWRAETLMKAGYDVEAAWLIASRGNVDLHHAVSLLKQGCAVRTALLILL
jgi:hypothetical protein